MTNPTSNNVTTESLDEAIRCIGLKMEVRKERHWTPNMVMWAEIAEIQTLLDWIAQQRSSAPETSSEQRSHAWYSEPDGSADWVACLNCGILRPLLGCLLETRPCAKPDGKRFFRVSCAQCRGVFGPRDMGYRNCAEHGSVQETSPSDERRVGRIAAILRRWCGNRDGAEMSSVLDEITVAILSNAFGEVPGEADPVHFGDMPPEKASEECSKGGKHDWSVWKKFGADGYTQNVCRKCNKRVTEEASPRTVEIE